MSPEVSQDRPRRKGAGRAGGSGSGEQHLTSMTGRHDASGSVHRRPEVVTITAFRLADVNPHAHPQRPRRPPRFGTQGFLRLEGEGHCITDRVEDGNQAVPGRLENLSPSPVDRLGKDRIVACQGGSHLNRVVLPKTGTRFDVGEQECLHRLGIVEGFRGPAMVRLSFPWCG